MLPSMMIDYGEVVRHPLWETIEKAGLRAFDCNLLILVEIIVAHNHRLEPTILNPLLDPFRGGPHQA